MSSAKPTGPHQSGGVKSATAIGSRGAYAMFEVAEITFEHAFLRSPLVLEPGEALTLELVFKDGSKLKIPALVESAELADGKSGIRVTFTRPNDRKAIAKKIAV